MRNTKKDRRSERVLSSHRLVLTILGPTGAEVLKEIIMTVDISKHGVRARGRRTLQPNWKGTLVQLNSGRQVPCRVTWQVKPTAEADYRETGIEIQANFDFWGRSFTSGDLEWLEAPVLIKSATVPPEKLLQALRNSAAFQGSSNGELLEAVWCGLVEQMEERRVFTRAELVAAIQKISHNMLEKATVRSLASQPSNGAVANAS